MAVPRVGSATWRDASYGTIRLAKSLRLHLFSTLPTATSSQENISPGDESTQGKGTSGAQATPPPFYRDRINNTCNAYACGYMRETRSSLYILRQAMLETNLHILRLQKQRNLLEQSHANIRRDIETNNKTTQLRRLRPKIERYPDKVDPLIQKERSGLLDMKRYTELQLYEASRLIKVLHGRRQKLCEFLREKGHILDIISENGCTPSSGQKTPAGGSLLGSESEDCQSARNDAFKTCERFRNIRPPNWKVPADCTELKDSVTQGLRQKAEETSIIRDDVTLALGGVRNMIQRQQRLYEELEGSYQWQLGPESNLDLTVREHLDRPLVRILQRHPGTQLPESTLISQASTSLEKALGKAQERIGFLHMTQAMLQEDQKNKLWGERIDRATTRMRVKSAKGRGQRINL